MLITTQEVPAPPPDESAAGWFGSVTDFLEASAQEVTAALRAAQLRQMLEEPGDGQLRAWRDSTKTLKSALSDLLEHRPEARAWGIVLEYELPRERGRRPDAVLLAPGRIIVMEFKGYSIATPEHLDQVESYARDLGAYHGASHDLKTIPVLVLSGGGPESHGRHVHVATATTLPGLMKELLESAAGTPPDIASWVGSEYIPLPTLVNAARALFRHEALPSIRRAQSAGIPQTVKRLAQIAQRAAERSEKHLALVTGVPGAGKTLVGLQLVYDRQMGEDDESKDAVFLSGNGPLVQVLQHALKSSVFVQDVHGFLKQYGGSRRQMPREHIWVYDEAQRAWDAAQVLSKRGHAVSEPADFVGIAERMPGWAMLVGLIGEGQEIHNGEEGGLAQWNEALASSQSAWEVHCPGRVAPEFSSAASVSEWNELDLTISLRSHLASDVQDWVAHLLAGRLDQAGTAAARAQNLGYAMYLTHDLDRAKQYARERYAGNNNARFGLIASSKARNLPAHGIRNDYSFTKRLRIGPWFNDPVTSDRSCCRLDETATEFQIQGLELDLPLLCWGDDLWWDGLEWASRPSPRSRAKDPHQLRVNSYRVLLSRGRDGFVIFAPPDVDVRTREALIYSGVVSLE